MHKLNNTLVDILQDIDKPIHSEDEPVNSLDNDNNENNKENSYESNYESNDESENDSFNTFYTNSKHNITKIEADTVWNISIGLPDVLFTLTINKSEYNDKLKHLIGKMVVVREISLIDLNELSKILNFMNIDKFNIVSVSGVKSLKEINVFVVDEPCRIVYMEMGLENFIEYLNSTEVNFLENNKNTIYIVRNGSYIDIKNVFTQIQGISVNVGRGGSQKSHVLSPLDFRLSCYLMAMFNFDFKLISYLNTFNDLPKNRYLPYFEKSPKKITVVDQLKGKLESKIVSNTKKDIFGKISPYIPKGVRQYHISVNLRNNDLENKNSVFSYLDQLDDIIEHSTSFYDAQKEIETSWITLMKKKLEDPTVSSWKLMPVLIKKSVGTLEKHEKRGILKRRFKLISSLLANNKYEVVLLTIAMLVSNYNKTSATNISIKIGSSIAFLLFKQNLLEKDMDNITNQFEYWKKEHDIDSNVKLLKLGDYFVNLFTNEPTQMFEFGLDDDDIVETTCERVIKICPEYIDIIKDTIFVHPTSLPMICAPNEWSDKKYGGFIENKYDKEVLNTGSRYHGHTIDNKESLYKAVNYINKTKFNVNKELLDYISNEGSYLLDEEDNNEKKNFQNSITLKVAKIYSKYTFYLNINCDWRSRLYTNSFFLSYQGGDLSRSLIEFADGEKLTEDGLKYLYIFGANCYSDTISKKSMTQRVLWVKNNLESIIKIDKEFINKAKKKIHFAAFCFIMKNYELDKNYLVKFPVLLDATCSGIQHLAAMLQDVNLGLNVNLLSKTEDDEVNDLYKTLVDPINIEINKFGKENPLHSSLTEVKLDRQILKHPIMTQVYSVTEKGISRQLASKFKKKRVLDTTGKLNASGKPVYNTFYYVPTKNGKEILLSYLDVYKMAQIINNASFNLYPSLKDIFNYFIDSTKLLLQLKLPIIWFTPAGLEICQFYYQSTIKRVQLSYFGKSRTSILREFKAVVDKRLQNQAIVPNIIHSMDASHLINVINCGYSKNIEPIISVHDCFGTHPNKMKALAAIVRSEFVLLYTDHNFLEKFNKRVINSINDNNYEIVEIDGQKFVKFFQPKIRKDGTKYCSSKPKLLLIPQTPNTGSLNLKNIIDAIYLIN